MPESPEVQAFVESLGARAIGRTIASVEVLDPRVLKTRTRPVDDVIGSRVNAVLRWGKHVDVDAGDEHLVLSFGRHGWAKWHDADADAEEIASADGPPVVARVRLDDGAGFDLTDAGGFRSVALWVVPEADAVPAIAKLGTDPSDPTFTRGDFERAVGSRRKQLKALLQEQDSLAGIGNAYSDEILHVARLSPVSHAASLDDEQRERLFAATRGVIEDAIAARRGVPIAEQKAAKVASMRVHGRTGEACPVCGDTIRDSDRNGTAQYCPTCQTGGAVL